MIRLITLSKVSRSTCIRIILSAIASGQSTVPIYDDSIREEIVNELKALGFEVVETIQISSTIDEKLPKKPV